MALFGWAESANFDRDAAPANITRIDLSLAPRRNRSNLSPIPPLSSRVAFCVSPICPTTRSIVTGNGAGFSEHSHRARPGLVLKGRPMFTSLSAIYRLPR